MATPDQPVGRAPVAGAQNPDAERAARRAQRAEQRRGGGSGAGGAAGNMLPGRARRRFGLERVLIRLIATGGIVGIGVALGAILAASNVQGWIIGLVVAIVSVVLSATLWSSRQL
jgi:hypothetical protein